MRPQQFALSFLFLLLPAIYSGCTKEDYLPGLTGNMVGYVYTFDEYGTLQADHSNVKITAIGLGQSYTDNSDRNGRFEIEEVPTGTYELHFEKSGFGVLKQFGIQHLGGNTTILPFVRSYEYAYFLYGMPTTTLTSLSIVNDSISVTCSFTTPGPRDRLPIIIFFSTSDNFSRQDAEYIETKSLWNAGGYYTETLYLFRATFNPGETVFYKACYYKHVGAFQPAMQNYRSIHGINTYFDYDSNETIYPNLGDESAQYSFIFPE